MCHSIWRASRLRSDMRIVRDPLSGVASEPGLRCVPRSIAGAWRLRSGRSRAGRRGWRRRRRRALRLPRRPGRGALGVAREAVMTAVARVTPQATA